MKNEIRTIYIYGLNKGFCSKFLEASNYDSNLRKPEDTTPKILLL